MHMLSQGPEEVIVTAAKVQVLKVSVAIFVLVGAQTAI
jgi:hypothetical protein